MEQTNEQNQEDTEDIPFVDSVFHLTDFSYRSERAFAHALAIALIRRATLTILHVGDKNLSGNEWKQFPSVRETLERWKLLEEGSPQSDVFKKLGVEVQKIDLVHNNVSQAALGYLGRNPTDILVLETEGRKGLPKWIKPSIAEQLSRQLKTKTLFVPCMSPGFVTKKEGDIRLHKILVPVDSKPDPRAAIEYAARAAKVLSHEHTDIILLHVGDEQQWPDVKIPENSVYTWKKVHRKGSPVDEIIKIATEEPANLIIMPTSGHDGLLDALRGSVTEQVLHKAPCPVLAVPAA